MPENKPVSKRLFIGSLPYRYSEGELLSLFVTYGKIVAVRIMHNRWGKSRGLGYVEFENLDDAINAKQNLHNYFLEDRTIIVDYAQPDPFLTPEGQARHDEAVTRRHQKHPINSSSFLPHPDSDTSDYQRQKKSFKNREYKGGKPVFNSVGKSLNRNTTGEYIPKFFPELSTNKKRFKPRPGQKPEYRSSSPLHVRSSVFKQRNFGSRMGAKFASKSKKK